MIVMTGRDYELRELARDLDREADLWRRRGLLGLADALHQAAEIARGWVGSEDG
jgi:hypothetical protein